MTTQVMNRRRAGLATIAILGAAIAAGACGSSYSSTPSTTPSTGTGGTASAADVTVTINGMLGSNSYSPEPVSVKVGQTVAWRNADAIAHTATGAGFDTGSIAPGATSAPIAFNTAGSVPYHCTFHPSMTGTVNVTQ